MKYRCALRQAGRGAAAFGLLLAFAIAGPAKALTVGGAGGPAFEVDPIYFTAFGQFGLSGPGAGGPNFAANAPITFLTIGTTPTPGLDLLLSQSLIEPVYQHPQDPANSQNPNTNGGVPSIPNMAVPFVADSSWSIQNLTGRPLDDFVLIFTRIIDEPGYPPVDVALDDNVYDVLQYTNASNVTRYFGAIGLGDLDAGETVNFVARYIVSGALPINDGKYQMPRFGLAGIESPRQVPEPGTALLLALGLAAIVRRGRV
jgi:PEP-CTERM motif